LSHAVLSELAEGDLAEIWVTVALNDIETADRLIEELRDKAARLAEQPLMGAARADLGRDVRSFPHGNYLLIYRPSPFGVGVARIVHGARDLGRLVIPRE
jgi:toxin ParE1/3/4